jgi:signal transduction histidine kinase
MQAIRLFTDVLRMDNPATRKRALGMLDASVKAGEALLTALLQVSRLDAGRVKPEHIAFDLDEMLADTIVEHRPAATAKALRLDIVPSGLWGVSDPALLRDLVGNLIANAVRYTERGRVLVGCRRRGDTVRIEVWDTGIGIASDKFGDVFDDFVQLGNQERDRTKGLGLGLAIVRRTAILLRHRVLVRSQPGRGSVFAVVLPRAEPLCQAVSAA